MASDGGLDQTVLQQDGDCSIVSTDKADIDQLRDGELTTARQAIIYQASDGDNHDGVADTSKALLHKNGVCDQATTNHAVQAVGEGVLAGHADRYNQGPSDKACHTDLYEGSDGILDTSAGQPALHKSTTCGLVFKVGLAVAGRATMHQAGDDVLETSAKAIHYQATGHATFFQASDSGQPDASYSAFDNASEKVLVGHTAMYQARDGVLAQAVLHNGSDGYTANHPTLYQASDEITAATDYGELNQASDGYYNDVSNNALIQEHDRFQPVHKKAVPQSDAAIQADNNDMEYQGKVKTWKAMLLQVIRSDDSSSKRETDGQDDLHSVSTGIGVGAAEPKESCVVVIVNAGNIEIVLSIWKPPYILDLLSNNAKVTLDPPPAKVKKPPDRIDIARVYQVEEVLLFAFGESLSDNVLTEQILLRATDDLI